MSYEIVVATIMMIGAFVGVMLPYLIKVWQDPKIQFDPLYFYALVTNLIVQVIALMPDSVPELTIKLVLSAFATGYGLQAIANKVVTEWRNKQN